MEKCAGRRLDIALLDADGRVVAAIEVLMTHSVDDVLPRQRS